MCFVPFWIYFVNNDELELLYRALAFAQSNFPQTLVNALLYTSLIMRAKKKHTPPLYLFVAILISYYYRISLSWYFFAKMVLLRFSREREKVLLKIFYINIWYIFIYIIILKLVNISSITRFPYAKYFCGSNYLHSIILFLYEKGNIHFSSST